MFDKPTIIIYFNFLKLLTLNLDSCIIIKSTHRGVEQLAARWAHNPKVGGSSPPPATNE